MTVFNFIGWSNTGKTGFIEGCIRSCRQLGMKPGVIKFASHVDMLNIGKKDSSRFVKSGAETAITAKGKLYKLASNKFQEELCPPSWDLAALESVFPGLDVVFVEGSPVSGTPIPGSIGVIFSGSTGTKAGLKSPIEAFDALVSSAEKLVKEAKEAGLKAFYPGEADGLIRYYCRQKQ